MSSKTKGIIFYSDGRTKEPITSWVWKSIVESGLEITKRVLEPHERRSYPTMIRQIIECLEKSSQDYVFFCESDVIYPASHFQFVPKRDDIFYYNENVWRWDYPNDRYVTYDRLISLSGMCCSRLLALDHFRKRLTKVIELGLDHPHRGEPMWLRRMGYEPGTKKIKRGGFWDDDFTTWRSEKPLIDIRHDKNFSPRKVHLQDFKHPPVNWREQNERP